VWQRDFGIAAETLIEIPESPACACARPFSPSPTPPRRPRRQQLRSPHPPPATDRRRTAPGSQPRQPAERERISSPDQLRRRSTAEQGKRFEDTTATLLRMLGYSVEPEQSLDGMRIDLVATLRQGLEHNTYLVECKDHRDAIGVDVVTKLHAALQLSKARASAPAA
jgi:hypothetical protein